METVEQVDAIVLTSSAGIEQGLKELQSGQTLFLDVDVFAPNATLLIVASNVELRGRPERTAVLCPRDGSALTVRFVESGS